MTRFYIEIFLEIIFRIDNFPFTILARIIIEIKEREKRRPFFEKMTRFSIGSLSLSYLPVGLFAAKTAIAL